MPLLKEENGGAVKDGRCAGLGCGERRLAPEVFPLAAAGVRFGGALRHS